VSYPNKANEYSQIEVTAVKAYGAAKALLARPKYRKCIQRSGGFSEKASNYKSMGT
jgi:hypothetical protein